MGNCLFGGLGEPAIRVTNSNGGVMEFFPPVTAGIIAAEFPGHAIFRSHDLFWKPLSHHHDLLPGHSYYLLPLASASAAADGDRAVREGHVRSSSVPAASLGGASASAAAPYRMSLDYQGMLKRSYTDVFSRAPYGQGGLGFWRVKLVISPEQLAEILSQEGKTQELIESVRTVAKCGGGGGGGGGGGFSAAAAAALSGGFSDQWSLSSSSRNASSKVDELMVDIIS